MLEELPTIWLAHYGSHMFGKWQCAEVVLQGVRLDGNGETSRLHDMSRLQ
jgi:hypothetical protein